MIADRRARVVRRSGLRARCGLPVGQQRGLSALLSGVLSVVSAFGLSFGLLSASIASAAPGPGPQDAATVGTAAKPARSARAVKTAPTHAWHDGATRRDLTLDATLEADFSPRAGRTDGVLQPAGTAPAAAAALVSPVLRDDAGRARALPGGVLVILKAPLDDAAARALFERARATASRRVSDSVWLLEGPPGLASLALANQLHDGGLFESAQPNWWVQRTLK